MWEANEYVQCKITEWVNQLTHYLRGTSDYVQGKIAEWVNQLTHYH